ncbi:hypothetical protein GO011_08245 [Mycobacterium sp. 20091114027_K0903767]|nr:hypothetical protein [Mycobacterium sp. 20091114027_K0903767]
MKKIPIPLLSFAVTAAIITTACSMPPVIRDVGPSPSKSALSAPKTMPAEAAASAVAAAKRFGADKLDEAAATAALESGRPVLVGLPDGAVPACHSALLVPGDPAPWILNRSGAAPTEGTALNREILQYGCDSGVERPTPRTAVPAPLTPLNQAAARAALERGVPYIWAIPNGPEAACHTGVMLPGYERWTLNRAGGAPVEGVALDRRFKGYGCSGRGETFGSDHDGLVLPGQTPAPSTEGGVR